MIGDGQFGSFQDQGAGIPNYWATSGVMPGAPTFQDQGAGISNYWATSGVMLSAPPGSFTDPVAPPRQPGAGRSRYNQLRAPVRSDRIQTEIVRSRPIREARSRRGSRPQPRPAPPVSRNGCACPRCSRVSKASDRIQASRRNLDRGKQRRSKIFGRWIAVSVIFGFLAYKSTSVLSPSGSHAAPTLWFLGSCLSLVLAVGCFIGNQLD